MNYNMDIDLLEMVKLEEMFNEEYVKRSGIL